MFPGLTSHAQNGGFLPTFPRCAPCAASLYGSITQGQRQSNAKRVRLRKKLSTLKVLWLASVLCLHIHYITSSAVQDYDQVRRRTPPTGLLCIRIIHPIFLRGV